MNYQSRKDVPWYHRQYILLSERFRDEIIEKHDASMKAKKAILEEHLKDVEDGVADKGTLWAIELFTEKGGLLDDSHYQEWLITGRNLFVADELCNDAGMTIDMPRYHIDQAERSEYQVKHLEKLFFECKTSEQKKLVADEITKQTRFAKANRRKAKTGLPKEKEVLKALLRR